jgi:hypothetical protein
MKLISVRQPYAWCLVAGHKPVENRGWDTDYRGPVAIHAGARKHPHPIAQIEARHGVKIDRAALQFGGIIGVVDLIDVVREHASTWFAVGVENGYPFGLVVARPRFVDFVPCVAHQGLYTLPEGLADKIRPL